MITEPNKPMIELSLSNSLRIIEPLLNNRRKHELDNFFNFFPKELSDFYGYEIDIMSANKPADFLCCVSNNVRNQVALANLDEIDQKFGDHSVYYRNLSKFSENWMKCKGLFQEIRNIWLEFDHDQLKEGNYTPNLFFGPRKILNIFEQLLLIEQFFRAALNEAIPKAYYKAFVKCLSKLPPGASVPQIGIMAARKSNSFRLFIYQLPSNYISTYLREIDWSYHNSELEFILKKCEEFSSELHLDIDVAQEVGPKIGLECYFNALANFESFVKFLIKQEYCIRQVGHDLVSFFSKVSTNDNSIKAKPKPGFHHIKLVWCPESGIKTKAYISLKNN